MAMTAGVSARSGVCFWPVAMPAAVRRACDRGFLPLYFFKPRFRDGGMAVPGVGRGLTLTGWEPKVMRSRIRRIIPAIGLALGGAFVLSGPGTGCVSYMAESILETADFCFIFDCQSGILGGTIDPCTGAGGRVEGAEDPLFSDCPELQGP